MSSVININKDSKNNELKSRPSLYKTDPVEKN